jgi:hypothetical protein
MERLADIDDTGVIVPQIGITWLYHYVRLDADHLDHVLATVSRGEIVRLVDLARYIRATDPARDNVRRGRISEGLSRSGEHETADEFVDALIVATTAAVDVMGSADKRLAGRIDGSNLVPRDEAAQWLHDELVAFSARSRIGSTGRISVSVTDVGVVVEASALAAREHPMRVRFELTWED